MPRTPKREKLLMDFMAMLRADRLSEHTVARYRRYVRDWLAWLAARKQSPERALGQQAAEWFAWYTRRYSPSTQGQILAAVERFYRWLSVRNIAHQSPFNGIRKPVPTHRPTLALSREQTLRILNGFPCRTYRDLRDKSMVMLMYDCAIRIGTLRSINYEDINWTQRYIEIHKAKRGKTGIVWFHERTEAVLNAYLSVAEEDHAYTRTGPLYPGCRGNERIDPTTICAALKRILNAVGIEGRYTPHSLRKSKATHLYEETGDVHAVQQLLWHESVSTTVRHYIKDNPLLLRAKIRKNHVFDQMHPQTI